MPSVLSETPAIPVTSSTGDRTLGLLLGIGHAVAAIVVSLFLMPFVMIVIAYGEFVFSIDQTVGQHKFLDAAVHTAMGLALFFIAVAVSLPLNGMMAAGAGKNRPVLATNFWQATLAGISAFTVVFLIFFFITDFFS